MTSWKEQKNQKLKEERGAGFEDLINDGELLEVLDNPAHPGQEIWVFEFESYAWALIHDPGKDMHITLYPSRKLTKRYLK